MPEPNMQTRLPSFKKGLRARAIWVRRALQRAEPGAPQKPGLWIRTQKPGGEPWVGLLPAGFYPTSFNGVSFAPNARRARREELDLISISLINVDNT